MEGLWVKGRRSRVVGRGVEEVMKVTLLLMTVQAVG